MRLSVAVGRPALKVLNRFGPVLNPLQPQMRHLVELQLHKMSVVPVVLDQQKGPLVWHYFIFNRFALLPFERAHQRTFLCLPPLSSKAFAPCEKPPTSRSSQPRDNGRRCGDRLGGTCTFVGARPFL